MLIAHKHNYALCGRRRWLWSRWLQLHRTDGEGRGGHIRGANHGTAAPSDGCFCIFAADMSVPISLQNVNSRQPLLHMEPQQMVSHYRHWRQPAVWELWQKKNRWPGSQRPLEAVCYHAGWQGPLAATPGLSQRILGSLCAVSALPRLCYTATEQHL